MEKEYLNYFPKKLPYPNQLEAMDAIHEALNKRQVVLFEGACGTGKTLSALAPSLHIAKAEKKTVVIATSVHQQMDQFIEEAREIKKQTDIKVVILKRKTLMCPKPKMNDERCILFRDNTYKLIEIEKDITQLKYELKSTHEKIERDKDNNGLIEFQKTLSIEINLKELQLNELKENYCEMLRVSLNYDKDDFHKWIFSDMRTTEDIKKWALSNNCCGYELLKRYMEEVELLVCTYNHFIDGDIRSNLLGWMNKSMKEIILIFDEAHNIESKARDFSIKITEIDIKGAIEELEAKRYPIFCWNEIPGKDDIKLMEFLRNNFDLNWIKLPKISKIDNSMTINISDGNKTIWFKLDDENDEARLAIGDLICKFHVKKENNKINIFKEPPPSKDFGTFLSVLLDTLKSTYNEKIKIFNPIIGRDWHDFRIADPEVEPKERVDTFKIKLLGALERGGIKNAGDIVERMKNFGFAIDSLNDKPLYERKNHAKKKSKVLKAAEFLSDYLAFSNDINFYPILSVRRQNGGICGRLELYSCIPKNIMAPLFNNAHAVVLMSATLIPFDNIKNTLGIKRETCELVFGLTFPKEKRITIAVPVSPLFAKTRDNPETRYLITKILNDIVEASDGNVLLLFPKFDEAVQYQDRLNCNVPIFLDKKGSSSQEIKDEFFRIGDEGRKAVLISYIGGTLTEGVNYRDNRCRTVVIIGVGYAGDDDKMKVIEAAYGQEFGDGRKYAFTIPTIRKVRQALGRVIRSPEDYGVKVLLDMRYTSESVKTKEKYSVFNIFPEDERNEFVTVEHERVKYPIMEFFNNIRYLKNKPLLQEKEHLLTEIDSLKQHIEDIEKYDIDLNAKLKIFEAQFDKIKHLSVIIEQKERKECLIREKEQLQIESEKFKQQKKHIESENAPYEVNIKIIEEEFNKIKKSIKEISGDIECARLYNANKKYISAYPGIKENAKKRGFLGKSSSELQSIIEIKENELGPLKNTENELRGSIEKEKDLLNKNSTQYKKCIEKISSNEKRINEIDSFLSSTEFQCIKEIDENEIIALKNKRDELISNIKKLRDSIVENNAQLFDFRNKKSLIDKRVNEINILLSSCDLQSVHM